MKTFPVPLEEEDDTDDRNSLHSMSTRQFHNLFYDGFYAPYMSNPDYLLLLDTRDEHCFLESHILSAQWHGNLLLDNDNDLNKFTLIILYDQDGCGSSLDENSVLIQLMNRMKEKKLDPIFIRGGFSRVEQFLPYMIVANVLGVSERQLALAWYPSIILDHSLWYFLFCFFLLKYV